VYPIESSGRGTPWRAPTTILSHLFTLGEAGLSAHPPLNVRPAPLDKALGEIGALALGDCLQVEPFKATIHHSKEREEALFDAAMRSGGQEQEMLPGPIGYCTDQFVALLLLLRATATRLGGRVRFIHDNQVGAVHQEIVLVPLGLDEIDAGDQVRIVPIRTEALTGKFPFQPGDGAGPDDSCLDLELQLQLALPLVAKVRWAEHADALNVAPIEQLAGDLGSLNGLANAHIVGNKHTDGVKAKRHDERNELVGAGPHREPTERTKRSGSTAQAKARCVPQQPSGDEVAGGVGARRLELSRLDLAFLKGQTDTT